MNRFRIPALLIAVMLVVGALCACGGDEPASSATETIIETTSATGGTTSAATTEATTTTEVETTSEATTETTVNEKRAQFPEPISTVELTEDELYDKMLGSWIGQMLGVAWCGPTEFAACGKIMDPSRIGAWQSGLVAKSFDQDDVYVDIMFLDAMRLYGYDCSLDLLGKEFADTSFGLWHANGAARTNIKNGILARYAGSYLCNEHCEDIDFQIECDFLGAMYPGLVNAAAAHAFDVAHIINYGDGVYGGVFLSAMHAAAYTAPSIEDIVRSSIDVIPEGTSFRGTMEDLWAAYKSGKTWEQTWAVIQSRWATSTCPSDQNSASNISAKLNSAYVAIGLLYGGGDMEQTIIISCRCGQDSDCNPSSAAAILGAYIGAESIPEKYKKDFIGNTALFTNTSYTLAKAVDVNVELAKAVLADYTDKTEAGWIVPEKETPVCVPYEQLPEGFYVTFIPSSPSYLTMAFAMSGKNGTISSVQFDYGDGTTGNSFTHKYEKTGIYTVKFTATSTKGIVFSDQMDIRVPNNQKIACTPICTVMTPTGKGNKDIRCICDGYSYSRGTYDTNIQYATIDSNKNRDYVFIGLEFEEATITGLIFNEGVKYPTGGWFVTAPTVEVCVGGEWTAVALADDSDVYSEDPESSVGCETFNFKLASPVTCTGIRLAGAPGGSAHFISVTEMTPVLAE